MHDLAIAWKYVRKAQRAEAKGIEFDLPFISFKNMLRSNHCYYTGLELTETRDGLARPTDRTVDRVNSELGYVPGNVVACCHTANQLKSFWENPNNPLTPEMVVNIVTRSSK